MNTQTKVKVSFDLLSDKMTDVDFFAKQLKYMSSFKSGIFADAIIKMLGDCSDIANYCECVECISDRGTQLLSQIKKKCSKIIKKYGSK